MVKKAYGQFLKIERQFGGKTFSLGHKTTSSKREMLKYQRNKQREGYYTRIVKSGERYYLYTRYKSPYSRKSDQPKRRAMSKHKKAK